MDPSLNVVSQFISLLLVLLFEVFLVKSLLIFNVPIDWVVKTSFIFPGLGKLLYPILTVLLCLFISIYTVFTFFIFVIILSINCIEIMGLPILLCSIEPLDLFVNLNLLIMKL